jgi:formyl-CoA transferase
MELAALHGLAIAPALRDSFELRDDPQLATHQILYERSHPDAGDFTHVGIPAMIDGQEFDVARPAPRLGQHTREVFGSLGLSEQDLVSLSDEGIT